MSNWYIFGEDTKNSQLTFSIWYIALCIHKTMSCYIMPRTYAELFVIHHKCNDDDGMHSQMVMKKFRLSANRMLTTIKILSLWTPHLRVSHYKCINFVQNKCCLKRAPTFETKFWNDVCLMGLFEWFLIVETPESTYEGKPSKIDTLIDFKFSYDSKRQHCNWFVLNFGYWNQKFA